MSICAIGTGVEVAMETDIVGSSGGIVRLSAAEQARQIVDARQSRLLEDQGVAVTTATREAVEDPRRSPSLYAQAAQYQLYTQSGTLAVLQQMPVTAIPSTVHRDDRLLVEAVDESHDGGVDTSV
jgi:hypothetical protein